MSRSPRHGFTLTELLVVIALIGVTTALLLPATRRVREAAPHLQCRNQLRQLMLGLEMFESNSRPAAFQSAGSPDAPARRSLPPGCFGLGTTPEDRLSWMVAVLPYLEQGDLYRQFDLEKGYAGNLPAAGTTVKLFLCPAAGEAPAGDALTHYVAMAGVGRDAALRPAGAAGNGYMGFDRLTSIDMIKDGAANTIALMETRSALGPWARGGASNLRGFDPDDLPLHGDQRPFAGHADQMHAAMVDGSVRSIRATIEPGKLAAAITIAGGEPFDLD